MDQYTISRVPCPAAWQPEQKPQDGLPQYYFLACGTAYRIDCLGRMTGSGLKTVDSAVEDLLWGEWCECAHEWS